MSDAAVPVIAIDGPSGTGKGTISRRVALWLNFHFLDSGALYRLLGLAARRGGVDLGDGQALAVLARSLDIRFEPVPGQDETSIFLNNEEVTDAIRTENCGSDASLVAAVPEVRAALLDRQRAFRVAPGLVADGRDMGTVVFPDAALKVYLTASREERANRRYKQLIGKGIGVTLDRLLKELEARDARDSGRAVAPMKPAADAVIVDTTTLNVEQVFSKVQALWNAHCER